MEDFVLLIREPCGDSDQVSQCEQEIIFKKWDDWFGGIAAQGKLVSLGIRLSYPGKVLKSGGIVTDGPFVEIRERLNGFIVIKADSIEDATKLADGCPVLDINGTVEIRPFFMDQQPKLNLHSDTQRVDLQVN